MRTLPATVAESVVDGGNVLVLVPPFEAAEDEACIDLLTIDDPAGTAVLSVTLVQSPAQRIAVWEEYVDAYPAEAAVVSVGDRVRSGAAADAAGLPESVADDVVIDAVSSPGNLTDLGIRITERFQEWAPTDHRIVVCVHSLSALLQSVDEQRAFKFLHVLTEQVTLSGAVAHYHVNPDAHEDRALAVFYDLFDAIVEHDGHGWDVKRR